MQRYACRKAWNASKASSATRSPQRLKSQKMVSVTSWMWKTDKRPDFSGPEIQQTGNSQTLPRQKGTGLLFTHTGSFALNAGIAGAREVLGVDASMTGIKQAEENAALNGLSDRVKFTCADVFELLPELEKKGEQYDVVILDPPAFTKSRSSIKNAVKGYREINLRGMKLVKTTDF